MPSTYDEDKKMVKQRGYILFPDIGAEDAKPFVDTLRGFAPSRCKYLLKTKA